MYVWYIDMKLRGYCCMIYLFLYSGIINSNIQENVFRLTLLKPNYNNITSRI